MNEKLKIIYFINMDRSVTRNKNMLKQLQENNLKYKRILAIDYKNNDQLKAYIKNSNKTEKKFLACCASHFKAIKTAYEDNLNDILTKNDLNCKICGQKIELCFN